MPEFSTLFEIFPYKYFKPSYLNICKTYNIKHKWTQNNKPASFSRQVLRAIDQKSCMDNLNCRTYARGDDVFISNSDVKEVINVMLGIETIGKNIVRKKH